MAQLTVTDTTSLAEAIALFGVADSSAVAELFLEDQLGNVVSDVAYRGSDEATFLVDEFGIPGFFSFTGGILLSTGDFPGASNTEEAHTVAHYVPGDPDLTLTAQAAFPLAGTSEDAAILEFKLDVVGDSVNGISFDIVFGSDEYPEFSDTDFVDVAAIYVNGVNVALFNDDPTTPLSVTQRNLDAGNFVDNDYGFGSNPAPYPIEWDGFSNVLTVRAALHPGENTVKIGIADTGDADLDSGLYLNNIALLSGGGVGGGVLSVRNGDDGDNTIEATVRREEINLFSGKDKVSGTPVSLNGDVITGFGPDDILSFTNVKFGLLDLKVTLGSAILEVDSDQNGQFDTTVTLAGDFADTNFDVAQVGADTQITIATTDAGTLQGTPLADVLVDESNGPREILGLGGDDRITGGSGDDTIDGGAGADTAVFGGVRSGYTVTRDGNAFVVSGGADGTDSLRSVEYLEFADQTIGLVRQPRGHVPDYGKDPGFLFDDVYYLLANPDLVATVTPENALNHYLAVGAADGRDPNSWFDPDYYSNRWDDLKTLNLDDATLFMHYNLYGVWEGRSAGPKFHAFDGDRYLTDWPDVAAYVDANVDDFLGSRTNGAIAHFIIYGADEQRLAYDTSGALIDMGFSA